MPRVGCDSKPTQTNDWRPKTRSARIITRQARVSDSLMAQCWSSFYDAGTTSMVDCLFAGNSATGTVNAVFLQPFYFTAFPYLYNCM